MSVPYISWAFAQRDMTAAQKLVLISLCERANGDRVCFPSFSKIADDCQLSRRAVAVAVRYLCDVRGLIAKVTDKHERAAILAKAGARAATLSTIYRIMRPTDGGNGYDHTSAKSAPVQLVQQSCTSAKSAPVRQEYSHNGAKYAPVTGAKSALVQPPTGAKSARLPVQKTTSTGAKSAPEPSKEPTIEPKTRAGAREEGKDFNLISFPGRKEGSKAPRPPPDHDPTPAEVEASRKAATEALAALPAELAGAIRGLGDRLQGVAYAPGRKSPLDRWEQAELLRPRPKAFHLTPEQCRAAREAAARARGQLATVGA